MDVDDWQKGVELPPSGEELTVDDIVVTLDGASYRPGVDKGVADDAEVEAVPQHRPEPHPAGLHLPQEHVGRGLGSPDGNGNGKMQT